MLKVRRITRFKGVINSINYDKKHGIISTNYPENKDGIKFRFADCKFNLNYLTNSMNVEYSISESTLNAIKITSNMTNKWNGSYSFCQTQQQFGYKTHEISPPISSFRSSSNMVK